MFTNCQLLLEGLSDALLMLDRSGYITYANPAAAPVTGYLPEELLKQHFQIFFPTSEDSIKADYDLKQAIRQKRYVTEGWRKAKDGSPIWLETTLDPLFDHENKHIGFSCLIRNHHEKKMEEFTRMQSAERFRLMVAAVKDYAMFLLDTKGNILTWNEGARRLKGYLPDEIIGKHFSIFYTQEDLDTKKPERELVIALETGRYEEEGWRVKKDGSLFWANVVITALFDSQDQHIGFGKVTRDLTDRRMNEENLRQSEERYRSLVEQVKDYGIFLMDENGRIASWNEGAGRIKGYTASEIIGKHFSIFYTEEDIINGKPAYELKVARATGKYEEEGWRLRKDGTRFWANVVITSLWNNSHHLIGFAKVTRDLTERMEAEKALRESSDNYRLLADELRQTNAELSDANEELEQFTSIVSHDLQEPIRTIKSFLQLIDKKLDEGQTEQLKSYLAKSIGAAARMRELIQHLLNYSQLTKRELTTQEMDVEELVQAALQNLKTSVDLSKAKISFETEVKTITGDRIQLVQLIQNLLSNALKFTDSDNPQVRIRCIQDNGNIKFAISDNGIGIAETDLQKVFEIFRRLHTKKDYPGTGIGLAICKKIVDRHGGRIWPESKQGKGTTFYFTLNEAKHAV